MLEFITDIVSALLLAALATTLGPRLLPRLKHTRGVAIFAVVFVVTAAVGLLATPLGAPVFDAAVLVVAMFVTMAAVLLLAAQRGTVPPVVEPSDAAPGPDERRWAALGVAFSYLWFALLFLALIGTQWLAY